MDKEDKEYLDAIIKEYEKSVREMASNIESIWKEIVQNYVYDVYDPKWYERTFQLRDKIVSKVVNDTLYVYLDTDNMEYYSFGRKDYPVDANIPIHVVDVGHDTISPFEGDVDMFRHYPARHILKIFYDRVKQEYPQYKIQVFRDTIL